MHTGPDFVILHSLYFDDIYPQCNVIYIFKTIPLKPTVGAALNLQSGVTFCSVLKALILLKMKNSNKSAIHLPLVLSGVCERNCFMNFKVCGRCSKIGSVYVVMTPYRFSFISITVQFDPIWRKQLNKPDNFPVSNLFSLSNTHNKMTSVTLSTIILIDQIETIRYYRTVFHRSMDTLSLHSVNACLSNIYRDHFGLRQNHKAYVSQIIRYLEAIKHLHLKKKELYGKHTTNMTS